MEGLRRIRPGRIAVAIASVVAMSVFTFGSTFASGAQRQDGLPCSEGGKACSQIGFTNAWLGGNTVTLEYSHRYFCKSPPKSGAKSKCEVGAPGKVAPPSGPIVSAIRVLVPLGFTPAANTLQCPMAGKCIDHPKTIDLSRLFGASTANAALPPHSHVLTDAEAFQSTWWPVVVVGVNTIDAWNKLVAAKDQTAVQACQSAGDCTADVPSNLYLFFQVLGPGAGPGGPA